MKKLTFSVINDLTYDQRMHRICRSLTAAGFDVILIGRKLPNSLPLAREGYRQKRLSVLCKKGKLMYLEFNLRLLFCLLFIPTDCHVAIDLDTMIPNFISSFLRRKKRVYDAHELFTELKEVVSRPFTHRIWQAIEKWMVPQYLSGYTVNDFITTYFNRRYGLQYITIRNLPALSGLPHTPDKKDPFVIYQGAVNEGRGFETLIPAMRQVNTRLVICGAGNFFKQVQKLIVDEGVQHKVELKGMVVPEELKIVTPTAYAAIMIFENCGLNQYQSLSNRFFDYIMAGVPQVCVNYPQYKTLNDKYQVAVLIDDTRPETITNALNNLLVDDVYYSKLRQNCLAARQDLNWQREEKALLAFYERLFETAVQ